jgi:hypothetical protein
MNPVLSVMLESAESFVERYCGRRFSPDPDLIEDADTAPSIEKSVVVTPADRLVRIPDVREVVSVTLGGLVLNPANYKLGNYSAASPAKQIELLQTAVPSFTQPETTLTFKGRFGFNPTPPDIVDAVLTIAARRYRERDASFSDAVQLSDGGLLSYFRSLSSNTQVILRSYKMPRVALLAPEMAIR